MCSGHGRHDVFGFNGEQLWPVWSVPDTLELVKDAVVLVQGAKFTPQVVVYLKEHTQTKAFRKPTCFIWAVLMCSMVGIEFLT